MRHVALALLVGLGFGFYSPSALAQQVDSRNFNPAAGPHSVFSVEHARTLNHLEPTASLLLEYASRPIVDSYPGGLEEAVVDQQLALHSLVGLGVTEWLQFDLHVPLYLVNEVEFGTIERGGFSLGDMGLKTKASFLNDPDSMFGVGASLDLRLPTGDSTAFLSNGFSATPALLFDVAFGDVTLVANLGARFQESESIRDVDFGSRLLWGVGAEYTLLSGLLVFGGELYGGSDFGDFFGRSSTPVEGLVGVKLVTDSGLRIHSAAGAGLTAGLGAPEFRTILSVGWARPDLSIEKTPEPAEPTEELDEPEEGVEERSQDVDEELDEETVDRDADGIPDLEDRCPDEPGLAKNDGCPPSESRVVVENERLKILEKIFFESADSTIKSESLGLLDEVALVLRTRPDIERVEIGGHTDDQGEEAMNLELSQSRAEAVRDYLVSQGVEPSRLIAKGYGATMPVDIRSNKQARARNRRVEFNILEHGATSEPASEESKSIEPVE